MPPLVLPGMATSPLMPSISSRYSDAKVVLLPPHCQAELGRAVAAQLDGLLAGGVAAAHAQVASRPTHDREGAALARAGAYAGMVPSARLKVWTSRLAAASGLQPKGELAQK